MSVVVKTAQRYIGYLEHLDNDLLGVFTANPGKGGCTIFAYLVSRAYRWRNFSGLSWCATFVYAVFIEALGKQQARKLLGKPHPGTRVLYRRFKRKGKLTDKPKVGDIIFLTNGSGKVDHCGIVVGVDGAEVITIEGNTVDPSGVFEKHEGGAVAQRVRELTDPKIICYGEVK
jgi:hypothetical protein